MSQSRLSRPRTVRNSHRRRHLFPAALEALELRRLLASYTVNDPLDLSDKDLNDGQALTVNGTTTLQAVWQQAKHDNDNSLNISFAGGLSIPSVSADFSKMSVVMAGTGVTISAALSFGPNSHITGIKWSNPFGLGFGVGNGSVVQDCTSTGDNGLGLGSNCQVIHCTIAGTLSGANGNQVTSSTFGTGTGLGLGMGNNNTVVNNTIHGGASLGTGNTLSTCSIFGGVQGAGQNTISGNFISGVVMLRGNANTLDNNIVQDGSLQYSGDFADPAVGITVSNNTFRNGFGVQLTFVKDSAIKNNRIFGSELYGIYLSNDASGGARVAGHNKITGNILGLDTSNQLVPNVVGINLVGSSNDTVGGTNSGEGNTIVGTKFSAAIEISSGKQYVIQGNMIGTDGTRVLSNQKNGIVVNGTGENTIGGAAAGAGNIVAANGSVSGGVGITVAGDKNVIQGNKIGRAQESDPAGFGNFGDGIQLTGNDNTIGGTSPQSANIIGGQSTGSLSFFPTTIGLRVQGDRNTIQGNRIGTSADAKAQLGNGGGLLLVGSDNTIGGTASGAGNVIANNGFGDHPNIGGAGILIGGGVSSDKNLISRNSIFGNRGRGIMLGSPQMHINDVGLVGVDNADARTLVQEPDTDTGSNGLQNFPFIDDAIISGGMVLVTGKLWSTPDSDYTIEVFANDTPHRSGFGDGQTFLGDLTVHTDQFGYASIFQSFAQQGGRFISATATRFVDGKPATTSELSMVDSDTDGLADGWEQNGIDYDGGFKSDFDLIGANPDKKDINVEVDSMAGFAPVGLPSGITPPALPAGVAPTGTILDLVAKAFADAPVINRGLATGINLHITVDQTLPAENWALSTGPDGFPTQFDGFKQAHFGTLAEQNDPNHTNKLAAKALTYRYMLFAQNGAPGGASGVSEIAGNDSIVAIHPGSFELPAGDPAHATRLFALDQAGTFMHEFGHQLGLHHGGGGTDDYGRTLIDNILYKPNFFSVMNYTWQIPSSVSRGGFVPGGFAAFDYEAQWALDYSRRAFNTIDESALDEGTTQIGGRAGGRVPVVLQNAAGGRFIALIPEDGPVDWDFSGIIGDAPAPVGADLNSFDRPSPGQTLRGGEDWSGIDYSFLDRGQALGANDGVHVNATVNELPTLDGGSTGSSDLALSQKATPGASAGAALTFTLTVRNNGPDIVSNVAVTDTLPPGATYQSATAGQGTFVIDQGIITFSVGTLATGAKATLTVVVVPNAAGTLRNTAHAVPEAGDPDTANNTSVLDVSVGPKLVAPKGGAITSLKTGNRTEKAISITFDGDLGVSSAAKLSLYKLVDAGKDKKFGTKDDKAIKLKSAAYDRKKRAITLRTSAALNLSKPLRLTINATALLDSQGRAVDGDRNQQPGGLLVAQVTAKGVALSRT